MQKLDKGKTKSWSMDPSDSWFSSELLTHDEKRKMKPQQGGFPH